MATKAKKSARARTGRSVAKASSRSARKGAGKKPASRKSAARKATSRRGKGASRSAASKARQSPVARVKRVTREVMQQATVAVTAGVESIRDFGGNIVDRVRQE